MSAGRTAGAGAVIEEARYLPSARVLAIVAVLGFLPVIVMIALHIPYPWWADYPGILFHLATFLLVARLPAPGWAKAAGYAWLSIDVTVGVMTLHGVPREIFFPIRLGGHIFGGLWLIGASLPGSLALRVVGIVAGLWLIAYTLASPFLPPAYLGPASLLTGVWLAIVAWQNGNGAGTGAAA